MRSGDRVKLISGVLYMARPPTNIDNEIIDAISEAHDKAENDVKLAREAITTAMTSRRQCGAMVEKLKQYRRQTLNGILAPVMDADQVKRYISINYYDRKGYDFLKGKEQLQRAKILDMGTAKNPKGSSAGPNVIGTTAKSVNSIEKVIKRLGGIERLPQWQREELRLKLQPLASAYVALVKQAK